jgi:hypothetical protein
MTVPVIFSVLSHLSLLEKNLFSGFPRRPEHVQHLLLGDECGAGQDGQEGRGRGGRFGRIRGRNRIFAKITNVAKNLTVLT